MQLVLGGCLCAAPPPNAFVISIRCLALEQMEMLARLAPARYQITIHKLVLYSH